MKTTRRKSFFKRGIIIFLLLFLLMNVVAFFHAYKFTHFITHEIARTGDPVKLSTAQKFKTLFFGVSNPRPTNKIFPSRKFETIRLKSNKEIECWYIPQSGAKGTIIIFHGYGGDKSSMLDKAEEFLNLGYSTLLVDFMGSGGSEGNQTTIGYFEAEQVKTSFEYLKNKGERNIFLFGTSMGSVAIMKAMHDYHLNPGGIILECPFGTMYKTVCARFQTMNAPTFPMAGLLVFWGGVQNGFWAFGHNPTEYAKSISCPTLLLYGAEDKKVSKAEIDEIFKNLRGRKKMEIYRQAGHENYLKNYKQEWVNDIKIFISS
ncbi:alpha/beta hydrolase [Flavitalea sp.]|nr:alpha/beta hydrolase [Flavitalea sp.]